MHGTNQSKIKKFQQLTDRFRGGLIKAPVYYAGVEELFGEDNVEVNHMTAHLAKEQSRDLCGERQQAPPKLYRQASCPPSVLEVGECWLQ